MQKPKMRYLNWRGPDGLETIDEMDLSKSDTGVQERRRLLGEYVTAGMAAAYWSSRPCKGWSDA